MDPVQSYPAVKARQRACSGRKEVIIISGKGVLKIVADTLYSRRIPSFDWRIAL